MRRFNLLFVVTVAMPTLLALAYYGLLASDVYISESRFVVRDPQRAAQGGLGALLQGTAFARSQDDTYSVHDFIRSRDALQELDRSLRLREAYTATAVDWFNRFPGITAWDRSQEALYRHYLRHVVIEYDTVSSITTLKVRAYNAIDAQRINQQLLEMGERLVNTMNIRSRKDLIEVAEQEVKLAEQRARQAAQALAAFRSDRGVFDPDRQSALQLQGEARLREELIAAQGQLDQVRKVSPRNPQIPALQARIDGLRLAVRDERNRVLGAKEGLSRQSPDYDRLQLEKTFADRQLALTLATLDQARNEAGRKQLYLERLVQPHVPDSAVEPRRLRAIFTVLMIGLLVWGVVGLMLASIREHQTQ